MGINSLALASWTFQPSYIKLSQKFCEKLHILLAKAPVLCRSRSFSEKLILAVTVRVIYRLNGISCVFGIIYIPVIAQSKYPTLNVFMLQNYESMRITDCYVTCRITRLTSLHWLSHTRPIRMNSEFWLIGKYKHVNQRLLLLLEWRVTSTDQKFYNKYIDVHRF